MYTVDCTMYSQYRLYSAHCTIYRHCTLHCVIYKHFALYNVQALYSVHCTQHTVQNLWNLQPYIVKISPAKCFKWILYDSLICEIQAKSNLYLGIKILRRIPSFLFQRKFHFFCSFERFNLFPSWLEYSLGINLYFYLKLILELTTNTSS